MKKFAFILMSLMFLAATLCSCNESFKNAAISQEEKIDAFLERNYKDSLVVFNQGVNRIVKFPGIEGLVARTGDKVRFAYLAYTFSTDIGTAPFASGEYTATIGKGEVLKGLDLGLDGMQLGEESYILFSCAYGFDKPVAGMQKVAAYAYYVKLLAINEE